MPAEFVGGSSRPSVQDDVAAARKAAADLQDAVAALRAHYGTHVDMLRLAADAERIPADMDLLAGPAIPRKDGDDVVLVPDTQYPEGFFADAEDEGIGGLR